MRSSAITNPQFWAEDGTVLFQGTLVPGCPQALRTFFRGFPYLAQKLVACAATPVALLRLPLVYNLVAYLVAAASLASLSLPWFRHLIRSNALRVVFCLVVATAPQATELVASLTNTAWYLGIWLTLMTVAALPRSPVALVVLSGAVLLATFSTPLVVLTAPLWVARALHAVRRGQHRDAGFAAVALAGVLALIAVAGDLGREPGPAPSLALPILNVVSTRVLGSAALGPAMVRSLGARFGPWVVYAIAVVVLLVLTWLAHRARRPILPLLLFCAYGIIGSISLPLVGHPPFARLARSVPALLAWNTSRFSDRYQYLAVSLVYLAFLATVDRLPAWRFGAAVLFVVWLAGTQTPTFLLPPFHDNRWPEYAAKLERKLAAHSPDPLLIPMNPDPSGFFINIEVDRRVPALEVNVPAATMVGSLLDARTFAQSFVARCANLSEIDLLFGREGRTLAQRVRVEIREAETARVVAEFDADAAGLVTDLAARAASIEEAFRNAGAAITSEDARQIASAALQAFHFAAVGDSLGKRYVISVAASGGTPGDAILVYGSDADAYPDGAATRDGAPISGDLVFRYACSPQPWSRVSLTGAEAVRHTSQ